MNLQDVDDCKPTNPCQNGGSCTDLLNAFKCSCVQGYTGDVCETGITKYIINIYIDMIYGCSFLVFLSSVLPLPFFLLLLTIVRIDLSTSIWCETFLQKQKKKWKSLSRLLLMYSPSYLTDFLPIFITRHWQLCK